MHSTEEIYSSFHLNSPGIVAAGWEIESANSFLICLFGYILDPGMQQQSCQNFKIHEYHL